MSKFDYVQEYVDGKHKNFKCSCGCNKFEKTKRYDEYDFLFKCKCGKEYNFAFGGVFDLE